MKKGILKWNLKEATNEHPKLQGHLCTVRRAVPGAGKEGAGLEGRSLCSPAYLHHDAGWRQHSFSVSFQRGLGAVPLSRKREDDGEMLGAFLLGLMWINELELMQGHPSLGVTIFLTLAWIAWRTRKDN